MSKEKKTWSASYGWYGSTLRVAEQTPGGVLYLFWIDNSGKQRKRSLRHRDRKRGQRDAMALAGKLGAPESSATRLESEVPAAENDGPQPLRLSEGLRRAFDVSDGMYPTETQFTREATRLADRAVVLLKDPFWTELTPRKVRSLTRAIARRSVQGEGARTAEYMCEIIYGVAGWLRDEEMIPGDAARPGRQWKQKLKTEWEAITGRSVVPRRPRHTEQEASSLFATLPQADPRLRLLIELAAELRAGQAVRAMRSDLELEPVGGFEAGRFTVRGRGKKHGEVVHLHPELRALVDQVLEHGYLSDAEAAFARGDINDYHLFPKGRLVGGKALLKNALSGPLGSTSIRGHFRSLERLAGVEHQPGRSFYGLRRLATDLAADLETDDRVLDRLTGHLHSETRKHVYQDRVNERLRARAAKTRRSMRNQLLAGGEQGVEMG